MTLRRARRRMAAVTMAAILAPAASLAQDAGKTAGLVGELVKLLDAAKANSIAAPLPGSPDQFVGALYFAGSQLLVVGAKYSVPQLITEKIAQKSYQDVYIDLNTASVPSTKVFITDLGADGIKAKRRGSEGFDGVELNGKAVNFDGEWGKAKLSEAEYMSAFGAAEDEYVKMLQALLAQAKK